MSFDNGGVEQLRQDLAEGSAELTPQQLASLMTFCDALSSAQTKQELFARAVSALQNLVDAPAIILRYYNATAGCLRLMAQVGLPPDVVEAVACLPEDAGILAEVLSGRAPAFSLDMSGEPERVGRALVRAGLRSLACVPLLAGDRPEGIMEIATAALRRWSEGEVRWLALLGVKLGVGIEHVRLSEQARDLAVAQERTRLGQEMHDGLGPLLSSIRLWAEELQAALAAGESDAARRAADKVATASQEATDIVREEVYGLRMSLEPGESYVSFVRRYLERFGRQWGVATELVISGPDAGAPGSLDPEQEIQLLRIMQEALTNVRRHAKAGHVIVTFATQGQSLRMTIRDDGVGFDQCLVDEGRFGIRIMRERAAAIRGDLHIRSALGQGAVVELNVPMLSPQRGGD